MRWVKGTLGWVALAVAAIVALFVLGAVVIVALFPSTGQSEEEKRERVGWECIARYGGPEGELLDDPDVRAAIRRCIDARVGR